MQLQAQDLEELAEFFSRRFPAPEDRQALVRSTGLDTVLPSEALPAWLVLLAAAQQHDRLGVLVQAAAALRPEDDSLADVAETFTEESKLPLGKALIALGVFIALGAGAAAWFATSERHINERVPEPEPVIAVAPAVVAPVTSPRQDVTETPAQADVGEVGEQVASASEPPGPPPEPSVNPTPPAQGVDNEAPSSEGDWVEGRCGGPEGRLVGYWYAGFPFEGQQGGDYVLQHSKNVRADYPRKGNGWNAREPVTCVLKQGDRVTLSGEPILVDGGKYWVPLYSGDLRL